MAKVWKPGQAYIWEPIYEFPHRVFDTAPEIGEYCPDCFKPGDGKIMVVTGYIEEVVPGPPHLVASVSKTAIKEDCCSNCGSTKRSVWKSLPQMIEDEWEGDVE